LVRKDLLIHGGRVKGEGLDVSFFFAFCWLLCVCVFSRAIDHSFHFIHRRSCCDDDDDNGFCVRRKARRIGLENKPCVEDLNDDDLE
jgi:hypothetical protein